jgi:membrane protein DedA with SNARE-associated domain
MILMGSRFIPGIRSLLVLVAGSSGMNFARAMTAAGVSALVWYGMLSIVSMFIGDNIHNVQAFMSLYGKWVWIVLGCVVLLYIGLKLFGRGRKKST